MFTQATIVFLEIGQSTLTVLDGDDGLELSLERTETGRLTPQCLERLKESLRVFLKKHTWRNAIRACCAISARGVLLRRLTLPACGKDEFERLIALQIEREFPLPPSELAWGYRVVANGSKQNQEVLVAAIKRDMLDEYSGLLRSCGLDPVFTLGALARAALCGDSSGKYALLDIGRHQSEIVTFDHGVPTGVRIVPWGGENLTQAIERASGLDRAEAEKLKLHLEEAAAANGEMSAAIQPAIEREVGALARSLPASSVGQRVYVTGPTARIRNFPAQLAHGTQVACERLDLPGAEGRSATILGLRKSIEQNGAAPPLVFQLADAASVAKARSVPTWKWAALAGLLGLTALALGYADILINQPRLERRLASMKAFRENLPRIERELGFLQYLKTNQPAYVDAIYIIGNSIGSGARIDSLTMNRSGDVSFRATMRDAQQVTDFRSKLIEAGFFSSVVVEEQSPSTADKQKLNIRVTAQWKLDSELPPTAPLSAAEKEKLKFAPAPPSSSSRPSSGTTNVPSSKPSSSSKSAARAPAPPKLPSEGGSPRASTNPPSGTNAPSAPEPAKEPK